MKKTEVDEVVDELWHMEHGNHAMKKRLQDIWALKRPIAVCFICQTGQAIWFLRKIESFSIGDGIVLGLILLFSLGVLSLGMRVVMNLSLVATMKTMEKETE